MLNQSHMFALFIYWNACLKHWHSKTSKSWLNTMFLYVQTEQLPHLLIVYYCITNYHEIGALKKHKFIIIQFCGAETGVGSPGILNAKIKVSAKLDSCLGALAGRICF